MDNLFEKVGAEFSECRNYRYSLWRIWDESKPLVMFIGLNPSTANEDTPDPTIQSVERISRHNGYGGFYMMNCWAFVSTDPKGIQINPMSTEWNNNHITVIASKCKDVVFAWGNFKIVKDHVRDLELIEMFPNALTIGRNKNGSPKHPLFQLGESILTKYNEISR